MAKRVLDVVGSAAALILLSPIMLIIALLIRLDSPGPIFYRATRIGQHGKPFKLYKFRSMVADADQRGPGITTAGDNRITRMGRVLRRTKLDELPQFLNVLRGEMSLVGPRPEDPRYVALYTEEQRAVLKVKPGITSPASVHYRNEEAVLKGDDWERLYVEHVMPQKLALDLAYVHDGRLRVVQDIRILWQTFLALWR
ncbi:MAG: sugar transferase [Anaerolineae bacterium]